MRWSAIEAIDRPFDGYQQTGTYIFREKRRRARRAGNDAARQVADGAARHSDFYSRTRDCRAAAPITLFGARLVGRGRSR